MHRSASLPTACAVAFAFAALGSSPASAINTYKYWDGSQYINSFGCPDTTTYGQVITAPKNKQVLNSFTFWWKNLDSGSMVVRGEVYAWDGTKATGKALYESAPLTITFSDYAFHAETFTTKHTVTPGAQYVLFASIDKDYEQCANSYVLGWGAVDDSVYSKGTFVYQNNHGDEGQWTTSAWTLYGIDLAFRAHLSP
jgi:hypothetical protein